MQNKEILFEILEGQHGNVGLITLNRPSALNALNEEMCIRMYEQLNAWKDIDNIKAVVVQGTGEKAFCAGGDIRTAYENRENISGILNFFAHEYRLDAFTYHYPKPYIALMDGITMGGGLGISAHAHYRIATERSVFAMPETGIGLFPDVGASYFLTRLKEKIGRYLGLMGVTIDVADALYIGLVNACIKSEDCENFLEGLKNIHWGNDSNTAIQSLVSSFEMPALSSKLPQIEALINNVFSAETMEEILSKLKNNLSPQAKEIHDLLLSRSPTSLKVTLELLKRGQHMSFDECIKMDGVLVNHFLKGHDFYEGVRAALIDKDKKPQWRPSRLDALSDAEILSYFVGDSCT